MACAGRGDRFKEEMKDRVEVARRELGRELASIEGTVGFHEMFNHTRDIRGISCHLCLKSRFTSTVDRKAGDDPEDGMWRWFDHCPDNLIPNQRQLRGYL